MTSKTILQHGQEGNFNIKTNRYQSRMNTGLETPNLLQVGIVFHIINTNIILLILFSHF